MFHRNEIADTSRRRGQWRLGAAAVTAAFAMALAGCTVATGSGNGGSDGNAAAGTGGTANCGSEATQEAITKAVDGRTIKLVYTAPILSEFYTQVEKAAHNRMQYYEDCYGVNWE